MGRTSMFDWFFLLIKTWNLITSPSSYQCIRRKTRLVHFVIHSRHISMECMWLCAYWDPQMQIFKINDRKILSHRIFNDNWRGIFILRILKIRYMPVFCLFTLGRHDNFTAEVTMEQPDLLSIIVCAVL